MAENRGPRRYVLVPQATATAAGPRVKRFRLARVAVTPHSALGVDRHERLEQIASRERR